MSETPGIKTSPYSRSRKNEKKKRRFIFEIARKKKKRKRKKRNKREEGGGNPSKHAWKYTYTCHAIKFECIYPFRFYTAFPENDRSRRERMHPRKHNV